MHRLVAVCFLIATAAEGVVYSSRYMAPAWASRCQVAVQLSVFVSYSTCVALFCMYMFCINHIWHFPVRLSGESVKFKKRKRLLRSRFVRSVHFHLLTFLCARRASSARKL